MDRAKARNAASKKHWDSLSPEERSRCQRESRLAHIERRRQDCREWRAKNKEKVRLYNLKYRKENPELVKAAVKRVKQRIQPKLSREAALRYRNDPVYRMQVTLRNRLFTAVKRKCANKLAHTEDLLGCSFEEFVAHIESLFQPGMTWENHGKNGWHIDHKRPVNSFDLSSEEDQRACFHYQNLQPLWAVDNLSKGTKWTTPST